MNPISILCLVWALFFSGLLSAQEKVEASFQPYFSYLAEGWSIMDGGAQAGERSLGLMIADLDWSQQAMDGGKLHLEAQSMHGPIQNCPDIHESQDDAFVLGLRFGIEY